MLAAGAATRFGSHKQIALLDGVPLLEHSLRAIAAAPVDRVVVVLGAGADEIVARVDLHGAEPIVCPRWEEGQSASLACGLARAGRRATPSWSPSATSRASRPTPCAG